MFRLVAALLWLVSSSVSLWAHEFWIEPRFEKGPNGPMLRPVVKIGEMLDGVQYRFEPRAFARALWVGPEKAEDLSNQPLANGPLTLDPQGDGLHVLAVESFPNRHVYVSEDDFKEHLATIGQADTSVAKLARLSADGRVIESYRRFSKTLIPIGQPRGVDQRVGLDSEWVQEGSGFRLYSGDVAVEQHPVSLICRATDAPSASSALLHTDADGLVRLDQNGDARCVLNAVIMSIEPDGSLSSDWVSVYFGTPLTVPGR